MPAINAVDMVTGMMQNPVTEATKNISGTPDISQVSRFEALMRNPKALESQLVPTMRDPLSLSSPAAMVDSQLKLAASVTSVELVSNVAGKASEAVNKLLNIQ